jgi:hypothetical protein
VQREEKNPELKKNKDFVEIIYKKGYDIVVLNKICNARKGRQ